MLGIALLGVALVGRYIRDIPPQKHIGIVEPVLGHERPRERTMGPLRVLPGNPRYFATPSGEPVLLVGSHTWANFNDEGFGDPPKPFDYGQYLEVLTRSNHNFFRLWAWEQARWAPWVDQDDYVYRPGPAYRRTGPGSALDGKPKFNLDVFDESYFDRLRTRVMAAGLRGIYVSVMLFNGWAIDNRHLGRGNPWRGHPFNRANNVNGVDGDPNRDDSGEETHQLLVPRVTTYQERYVARVIDAVSGLDNVLYEISNESYPNSRDWQYHMISFIHQYETTKGSRHPVGMTSYAGLNSTRNRIDRNPELFASEADWIATNNGLHNEYATDPPPAAGRKVVVLDTDHIWGIGGDRVWAWKAFLRGYNLLFMDGYDGAAIGSGAPADFDIRRATWKTAVKRMLGLFHPEPGWDPGAATWVSLRANLGHIRDVSMRVRLGRMTPQGTLSSTGYVLADRTGSAAAEYLVYQPPPGGQIGMDLSSCGGALEVMWFEPGSGRLVRGQAIAGGAQRVLIPPFPNDAVLHLRSDRC